MKSSYVFLTCVDCLTVQQCNNKVYNNVLVNYPELGVTSVCGRAIKVFYCLDWPCVMIEEAPCVMARSLFLLDL